MVAAVNVTGGSVYATLLLNLSDSGAGFNFATLTFSSPLLRTTVTFFVGRLVILSYLWSSRGLLTLSDCSLLIDRLTSADLIYGNDVFGEYVSAAVGSNGLF